MSTETKQEPEWMQLARDVSTNPAAIRWPTNALGVLAVGKLRKAIAEAASAMAGNPVKEELVIATLMVGLAHIKARRDKDKRTKEKRLGTINDIAAERTSRDGWHPLKKES